MFCVLKKVFILPRKKILHQAASRYSEVIHNKPSLQHLMQNVVSFGQPTAISHPHLLKEGELLPGIQKHEFKLRQTKFVEKILDDVHFPQTNAAVIIIPSSSKVYMSEKIPYVFRQNTDFLYFSGCQEPDSILVITLLNGNHSTILFVRPKDNHSELWDGPRTGVEGSIQLFEINNALPTSDFEKFILSFINENKNTTMWYDSENVNFELHKKIVQIAKMSNVHFRDPKPIIHQIRVVKSNSEINLMKNSCTIAGDAISKTIEISRPGMSESELFATVDYECRMRGAEFLAYPPVIAGGKNANIIHYISNNQIINDNETVLMDAGCEYHAYTSDITRTWPINGHFSDPQKILYEIILDIQKNLIDKFIEMPSLDMLYHDMCVLLGRRLQEELIIPKSLSGNELLSVVNTLCPHHVSHYLGMDVHDTGKISRSIRVTPGMIVTVEPGIYMNPKTASVPPEFHDIGIRIEDDVLIENNGAIVLSKNCPKETKDIEFLAQNNQENR